MVTGRHPVTGPDVVRFRSLLAEADRSLLGGPGATGGAGGAPSPLGLLAALALRVSDRLLSATGLRDGVVPIHGAQRLRVLRPVLAGDVLLSTASVASVKPLGAGIATEVVVGFTAETGDVLAESTALLVHGPPPTGPTPAAGPARPAGPPGARAESAAGEEAPRTSSFAVTRALLREYAEVSGDHNPIHQSESAARAAGFSDVIAHGLLTFALAGHHLAGFAGEDRVSELRLRFARPLVVRPGGAVVSVSDSPVPGHDPDGLVLRAVDGDGTTFATGRAVLLRRHDPDNA
ncbi:MaoC/PaaZ C-terminal domain-containing protein [Streptomyces sp. NPDC058200]|uniref:MaoC/PaaZ C-terminal domain-containing protein n=1 Tax=Streptomyces sp. NPDC058200 TaxID=3346378 RepID=UPI0036EFE8E1